MAVAILLGFLGLAVQLAAVYIGELPPAARASVWGWFLVTWAVSAVAIVLLLLPAWIKGTSVSAEAPSPEESGNRLVWAAFVGGGIGIVGIWLGLLTLPFRVCFLAFGCGGMTAGMVYLIALHTTKRGRAVLDESRS